MSKIIYGLTGLPGAGKSTVASVGRAMTHGDVVSVGEILRNEAEAQGIEDPTSEELGQFASDMRDEHGNGFAMDAVIHPTKNWDTDWPVFVDSVRHIDGYEKLDALDIDTYLLWVSAGDFDQRLERIQRRSRDDEGDFTIPDLLDRDAREIEELGLGSILDAYDAVDYEIVNDSTYEELQKTVEDVLLETGVTPKG